jgi:hypothetical protein
MASGAFEKRISSMTFNSEIALLVQASSIGKGLNTTVIMRKDWDDRARKGVFHYIASWRKERDLSSFLASGEEDDALWSAQLLSLSRATASLFGFDPCIAGQSWRGATVQTSGVLIVCAVERG